MGVADILWKRLKTENKDLFWRSRLDNPVNKWYQFCTKISGILIDLMGISRLMKNGCCFSMEIKSWT